MKNQKEKIEEAQNEPVTQAENKEFTVEFKGIDLDVITKQVIKEYTEKTGKRLIEEGIKKFIDIAGKKLNERSTNFESEIKDILKKEIAKLRPIEIKIGEREKVTIEGRQHKAFQECLFICEQEKQLFVSGAAGSGKTTLASQIAEAFGLNFKFISCSAGLSESHLLGRMLFDGSYVASDFVTMYEDGGIFLFDEVDAADANTMLVINSALSNGYLSIPNRKGNQVAKRNKDFICICAANTWGYGSFEYHGRNHLDVAFLDRFAVAKVAIDYDTELEKELCPDEELFNTLMGVRNNIRTYKLRRVLSTRAFISGMRQRKAGKELEKIMDTLFLGWSQEEITKAISKN